MNGISFPACFILEQLNRVDPLYILMVTPRKNMGGRVYQFPIKHGTLQIGFFNYVLHGVETWEGQYGGIQMNIKKDVLQYFIKYGTKHYDKYHVTGYPQ